VNAPIPFVKMSGSGNDFILVDNRRRLIDPDAAAPWVVAVCRRALSLGADGVILVENDAPGEADFAWRFFNSDGSEAEMCGNGGRCVTRFAFDRGIATRREMSFRTRVGLIRGWVLGGAEVRVELTPPRDYRPPFELRIEAGRFTVSYLDTGVPHAVLAVNDVAAVDVATLGARLRHHPVFAPRGANVNFVQVTGAHDALIRTFERGVENETLACGTGNAAAAVTLTLAGRLQPPVHLKTRGGETLTVDFTLDGEQAKELTLQGPVRYVAEGELHPEAWQ
jgi:diaminopimelate epimerase